MNLSSWFPVIAALKKKKFFFYSQRKIYVSFFRVPKSVKVSVTAKWDQKELITIHTHNFFIYIKHST